MSSRQCAMSVGAPSRISLVSRIEHLIEQHAVAIVLIVVMFVARWFLADWTSYWLDELLSVNVYGRWHESVGDAIQLLADRSIHPPLFQFVLYHWMELFGDTEIATRSLSNLYIALASLFLYLSLEKTFGKLTALTSLAAFSLMYAPVFVGLETRSYAQTMFLVTFSSYFILHQLRRVDNSSTLVIAPSLLVGLTTANTALLLTHYYNFFFLAVQVVFLAVYLLWKGTVRSWRTRVLLLTTSMGIPVGIFGLIWGDVFIDEVRRGTNRFALDGSPSGPASVLVDSVIDLNLSPPRYVLGILAVTATVMLTRRLWSVVRLRSWTGHMERVWMWLYLFAWLVGPVVVSYAVFLVLGAARYNLRYFLFAVPPLAPLLVLTVEGISRGVAGRVAGARNLRITPVPIIAVIGVIALWVSPTGLEAATHVKHDWRGIVKGVVDVVEADPQHSYIIFQASRRGEPLSNYYFERFSSSIRAAGTLQSSEEASGSYRIFTDYEEVIQTHDYLVVLFPHLLPGHFPRALAELEERYEVQHRQVNHVGRGFIIFKVSK